MYWRFLVLDEGPLGLCEFASTELIQLGIRCGSYQWDWCILILDEGLLQRRVISPGFHYFAKWSRDWGQCCGFSSSCRRNRAKWSRNRAECSKDSWGHLSWVCSQIDLSAQFPNWAESSFKLSWILIWVELSALVWNELNDHFNWTEL